MNRKQLLILLALVVIVGGAGLAVFFRSTSSWKGAAGPSGNVLTAFPLNDVARVVIQANSDAVTNDAEHPGKQEASGGTVTLVKKNDVWVVAERGDYPADFARIGGFIQRLWELKPVQEVNIGPVRETEQPISIVSGSHVIETKTHSYPAAIVRLGLVPPAKGVANTATLVDLQDKDGKRLAALLVGKKYLKKSPDMPDDQGMEAGRYVMPAGTAAAKVSLVSDRMEQADPNPAAWLDKTFLRIDRIQSVAVVSGTNHWKLSRTAETATDWDLEGIPAGEKLDPAKTPSVAGIFGAPTFTDVQPADAKRDGFDATATVTTFDGLTYTLRFGKADGDKFPMTVSTSVDLVKSPVVDLGKGQATMKKRTPGKDEKPEEAKKLDEEFAAKAKQFEETLAKAKALEARVYLVPKASYDALWKPSSEFLASKEQPKPSQGPDAPAAGIPAGAPMPFAAPAASPAGK